MDSIAQYHAHTAKLQTMGEHWHHKLWYGSGQWTGDRYINIYHHPLKDEIEVRYELPDKKPELIMQIALADFDIDKLCAALHKADNKTSTPAEKLARVDAENAKIDKVAKDAADEKQEALMDRMYWAARVDTGHHIKPMTIPTVLGSKA